MRAHLPRAWFFYLNNNFNVNECESNWFNCIDFER
jgi:hypothetical protein